jgi:hypothetical protein
VWPRRLIQLLIGAVYFGAAITKIQTPEFFTGEQLMFWMLTHMNHGHPLGEWLAMHPSLIMASAYVTVVWEILFIFVAWRGLARTVMLSMGVLFHAMTYLTLGLVFFPLIYFVIYWSFCGEADFVRLRKRAAALTSRLRFGVNVPALFGSNRAAKRWGWGATAAYFATLPAVAVGGIAIEHGLDPYRLRAEDGPLPLREISLHEARRMLRPTEPIRTEDKFFSFTIGSTRFVREPVAPRDGFEQGDTLYARTLLQPTRDDLFAEYVLVDADGDALGRWGAIIPREQDDFSVAIPLKPGAIPAGEHRLELRLEGRHVASRSLTVR